MHALKYLTLVLKLSLFCLFANVLHLNSVRCEQIRVFYIFLRFSCYLSLTICCNKFLIKDFSVFLT